MINLFPEELNNPNTKFFIFDTGKHENIDAHSDVGDIDFERYTWNRKRFNKVDRGDLFIYRNIYMYICSLRERELLIAEYLHVFAG